MIKIAELPTGPPEGLSRENIKEEFQELQKELKDLQYILQAQSKYSILVVLQGMDASGKDGTIRKVFGGLTPIGVSVQSFKKPSDEEFSHDFLWRVHKAVPSKGMIKIFNRSHYEDVLIQRVHNWIDMETVKKRWKAINAFEELIHEQNDTFILKFFLNVSKEKQLEKLNDRTINPKKFWKHNPNDMKEREHWTSYMEAYQDVINHCGSQFPWIPVPCDENWYKEYFILQQTVALLKSMPLEFPPLKED